MNLATFRDSNGARFATDGTSVVAFDLADQATARRMARALVDLPRNRGNWTDNEGLLAADALGRLFGTVAELTSPTLEDDGEIVVY